MTRAEPFPRLMVLSDTTRVRVGLLLERVEGLVSLAPPGQVVVQLRDRQLPVRDRLALGHELSRRVRANDQLLIVNDRLDLVRLLSADGAHLPGGGVSPARAREFLGPEAWLSTACHPADGPLPSSSSALDALLVSPVLAPRKDRPALGLDELGRLVTRLGREGPRVLALGGIDAATAGQCLSRGAAGVAVIGAALEASDPKPLLRSLGLL